MESGNKISAVLKKAKTWLVAHKLAAGIAAGVLVLAGGTAVALGAGFLPTGSAVQTQTDVQGTSQAELSSEDIEAAYEPNLLRGDLMGQPLLDAMWESLEAKYTTEAVTTTQEETTEETTEKKKIEIPPVVVAPVDDKEDEQPQNDVDKGVSEEIDISDVINDDTYENAGRSYGIDVSKWQGGNIDWAKVAESGVEFVMIRVGYRGNQTGEIMMDPYFTRNIKGALANHIKVGIYFYSQAIDEEEARVEAAWVVNAISKYQITYPVVYDCEGLGQNRIKDVDKTQRSKNAVAFLDYIRSAGYTPMMYASKNGYRNNWDMSIIKNCKIWLAHYTSGGLSTPSDYSGTYHMWQYTSKGSVPGISGNVDMNLAYFTYSNTPDPVVGTVTYTVRDDSGTPVKGVTVSMKGDMTRKTLTAVTDDNGAASFKDVVVDTYAVSLSTIPDGYKTGSASTASVEFGKAEDSYSGELTLDRVTCSGVTYQVVDEKGSSVAGVTLTLKGTPRLGSGSVEMTAVTDASGNAVFKNVLLGSYEVYAAKAPDGYVIPEPVIKESITLTSDRAVTGSQKITVNNKPTESETPESSSSSESESGSTASTESETQKPTETAKPTESSAETSSATAAASTET